MVKRSSTFPLCVSVKRAPVAQRTERVASDHQVAGSIPAGRARSIFSGRAIASQWRRARGVSTIAGYRVNAMTGQQVRSLSCALSGCRLVDGPSRPGGLPHDRRSDTKGEDASPGDEHRPVRLDGTVIHLNHSIRPERSPP